MLVSTSLLALALSLSAPSDAHLSPPSSDTGQEQAIPLHGGARGLWSLPGPLGPGRMRGLLRGPFGIPLFQVEAYVVPDGSPGPSGELHGVVKALHGPNQGPVAALRGRWQVGGQGPGGHALHGAFAAVIVVPGDPSTGTPPTPIGNLVGGFVDPLGPLPPGGLFQGFWVIQP